MTTQAAGCHVALWSEKEPGTLVIKDPDGTMVDTLPVTPDHPIGDRPGWRLLHDTGWSSYPGGEWHDDNWTGDWEISVFPASLAARKR